MVGVMRKWKNGGSIGIDRVFVLVISCYIWILWLILSWLSGFGGSKGTIFVELSGVSR